MPNSLQRINQNPPRRAVFAALRGGISVAGVNLCKVLLPQEGRFHLLQPKGFADALTDAVQLLLDHRRPEKLLIARHAGILQNCRPIFLGIAHRKQIDKVSVVPFCIGCICPFQIGHITVVIFKFLGIKLVPLIQGRGLTQYQSVNVMGNRMVEALLQLFSGG